MKGFYKAVLTLSFKKEEAMEILLFNCFREIILACVRNRLERGNTAVDEGVKE